MRLSSTKKKPRTDRVAIVVSSSCMWVTNLAKCCIFGTARVYVTVRMACCQDAKSRAMAVCAAFFCTAATKKKS